MIRTFIVEIDDSLRGAKNDIFRLERAYGAEEVKTGHWIHLSKSDKCSECGYETGRFESESNYCPGCGAKMVKPQESEDKE